MSLSKPECLVAFVAVGALLGYLLTKYNQRQEVKVVRKETDHQIRDNIKGKCKGKKVQLMKRSTTYIQENDFYEKEEKPQEYQDQVKKLIQQQQLVTQQLLQLSQPCIDRPPHLVDLYGLQEKFMESPLIGDNRRSIFGGGGFLPKDSFMNDEAFILATKSHQNLKEAVNSLKFLKAGPREYVYFNPIEVKAAIVTCGGLCPGLNVVIREIVMCLHFNYEVAEIWGVQSGYKGFYDDSKWIKLEPKLVKDIHKLGGTILGSSRGGFDGEKILDALKKRGINQVYIIGGDGTHRGMNTLMGMAMERKMVVSFAGVPKTIDNDIPIMDHSFGFNTACEKAVKMIDAAYVEAKSAVNGVGLVKLMGRYSGYIGLYSTLSHWGVDFLLIPERPFELHGPAGLYQQVVDRIKQKKYCVIVVTEGAEMGLINEEECISKDKGKDESGNLIFADIGTYLKQQIVKYGKEKYDMNITLKYIDPTYVIRSCQANAVDTILCAKLAQNAVHGAMAGYTGFSIGIVRNTAAMIPIRTLIHAGVNKVSMHDKQVHRMMQQTDAKFLVNDQNLEKAGIKIQQDEHDRKTIYQAIVQRVRDNYQKQMGM